MEYIDYFKRALEQFERDLKADAVRLNTVYSELDSLKHKKGKLTQEIEELKEAKVSLGLEIEKETTAHEEFLRQSRESSDKVLAKAHELMDIAKKEHERAKNIIDQAQKEYASANESKRYWDAKTTELKVVLGESI
jgi:chromosome segregation ATPase